MPAFLGFEGGEFAGSGPSLLSAKICRSPPDLDSSHSDGKVCSSPSCHIGRIVLLCRWLLLSLIKGFVVPNNSVPHIKLWVSPSNTKESPCSQSISI